MSDQKGKPLPPTRELPEIPEGLEPAPEANVWDVPEDESYVEEPSTAESMPAATPEVALEGEGSCPHLVLLFGRNIGQVFKLDKDEVRIGRERTCAIQFADTGISRQHAAIVREPAGGFTLRDLDSRNGTYRNESRITEPERLRNNDLIHVGSNTVLKFIAGGNPEVDYALSMYAAAMTDVLTGTYNRRYLEEQLGKELAYARRHGVPLALLLMDLDHFKQINDTLGHPVGDEVLKEFATLLGQSIRAEDIVARYGGEEFAILCRNTGPEGAAAKAERIRTLTADHVFCPDTHRLRMTVSIGVAAFEDTEGLTPQMVLSVADQALYQAKENGRDQVVVSA